MEDLINKLLKGEGQLSLLILEAKAYADKSNDEEFKAFLNYELDGYRLKEPPEYRTIKAEIVADIQDSSGRLTNEHLLDISSISDNVGIDFSKFTLYDDIGFIEDGYNSLTKQISLRPIHQKLVKLLNEAFPKIKLIKAYHRFPKAAWGIIPRKVRQRTIIGLQNIKSKESEESYSLKPVLDEIEKLKSYKFIEDKENEMALKTKKSEATNQKLTSSKNKVFIVHGHDNAAKEAVARFVEKLGLEAIILHEQTSGSDTVIEKIEKHTNVGFSIVLYTFCDIGNVKNKSGELNQRARQNVVFEHGYLIGKHGRQSVAALVKGKIETPSDISGMVYISMNNGNGWKVDLAQEMKAQGLDVDLNKLL